MSDLDFKESFFVRSSEANIDWDLKLSSLFKLFQNTSVEATESLGMGKDKTLEKGYLWVISRVYVVINKMPKYLDNFTIETYPEPMMHFIYPRQYLIKDETGNILVRMSAVWALISAKTRKILFPSETNVIVPGITKGNELEYPVDFVKKDVEIKEKRIIRNSDTDINGHLNNTRYVDFIQDLKACDKKINTFAIAYFEEVKEGEVLVLSASLDATYFTGKVNDKLVFEAEVTYK